MKSVRRCVTRRASEREIRQQEIERSRLLEAAEIAAREATERARDLMAPYPPSSPSVALLKDGKLVYMMQRRDIETRDALSIASALRAAFDEHCQ